MRHMTYSVDVFEREESTPIPSNVLARTVPINVREHLYYRWQESDGVIKTLHLAISGDVRNITASIDVDET
jgi:hypothetical protein